MLRIFTPIRSTGRCSTWRLPLQLALAGALFFFGGWAWVVWGVFVRLVFSYHSTWLVNSAAHMLGYRTYRTTDCSTNCWWVALLSFGEGWHNNHHAFPFSARHGLRWFEIDMTWWHVELLAFLRLADRIRIPSRAYAAKARLCEHAPPLPERPTTPAAGHKGRSERHTVYYLNAAQHQGVAT